MIALWPHWFRPWWLLLLPLLGWLLWQLWHRQKRAGRWQMILPPAFHSTLLSVLLVLRERWPQNPLQRFFTQSNFLLPAHDWRQRLKRLRLRRRR